MSSFFIILSTLRICTRSSGRKTPQSLMLLSLYLTVDTVFLCIPGNRSQTTWFFLWMFFPSVLTIFQWTTFWSTLAMAMLPGCWWLGGCWQEAEEIQSTLLMRIQTQRSTNQQNHCKLSKPLSHDDRIMAKNQLFMNKGHITSINYSRYFLIIQLNTRFYDKTFSYII